MGNKVKCDRKRNELKIRDFSECQWSFIAEQASIESIRSNRIVSLSAVVAKIVREKMKCDGYSCGME